MMEPTAGCRDRSTGRQRFDRLTDAYRCFLVGSRPTQPAVDLARVIFSGVCGPVPGEEDRDRDCVSSEELTCISLTLVEKMTSTLTSGTGSSAETSYCLETLTVLLQDLDLMSHLVLLFQTQDQIISHLAAKTTSACVFYQIYRSVSHQGPVSPVWQQKCVEVFHGSPPGPGLDCCLWSLTEVLKRLVRGAHREVLVNLLAALDSGLNALCSNFLPEQRGEVRRCLEDGTISRRWGTTSCLLLDLLEVLTASGLMCPAGLQSQRLTHIHSSALLTTISCSSQYVVKKRAVLLLKRAVLLKAGEDWALGDVPLTGLKHLHSDMNMLAHSVLTAVAAGWLDSVQVESASFFGGTRQNKEGQRSDCVMLRAVSLILVKSMELHIQTAGGTAGPTEVYRYLQSLWGFLRRSRVQLTEVDHCCSWVSLLFGDQDDDMMEAAKALFSIFLHHRLYSGLDDTTVLEAACVSGCNPHCHFLLLLQSISFDHSILLDFLISTETCFLEYFVRYLKYLTADWRGFTAVCGRIRSSDRHVSLKRSLPALCAGDVMKGTNKGGPAESSSTVGSAAGFHLVEYDSSDDSDPENMEVEPPPPIRQNHNKSPDSEPTSTLGGGPEEQTSCSNTSGQPTCETLTRALVCMSELRLVVTRLQTKKLFPYNPASLLKLLTQVHNCSSNQ